MNSLKTFFAVWLVCLIGNQVLLYSACFEAYCIKAALPHTFIISIIITAVYAKTSTKNNTKDDEKS